MGPRVLILTSNSYRQIYFANEINKVYKIAGVIVEQKFSKGNRFSRFLRSIDYDPRKLVLKVYYKIRLYRIDRRYKLSEINMLLKGDSSKYFPKDADVLKTDNINSPEVSDFIKRCAPDIILVSGTSLVKKHIIYIAPSMGMINMHTGLSPYYRGGPCTFWCLFNEELQYLGVTIHYLSTGVDSGHIILSERETDIGPDDNEATLDCKVIMRGARLMIKAIGMISNGKAPKIVQWEKGRNFLSSDFTPYNRLKLEKRLKGGLIKKWLSKNKDVSFDHIRQIKENSIDL